MTMDVALTLRIAFEKGERFSSRESLDLLKKSSLVEKLTRDFEAKPLFAIFRLMGVSEIPGIAALPYTQNLIRYINECLATPEGFSYQGRVREIVPCYNAMLLEAYTRLGLAGTEEAQNALNWIKHYQLFERDQKTSWPHDGICRHGGCLRSTPCFIGVGKSVRALVTYRERLASQDPKIQELIRKGTAYMLQHRLYRRLSDSSPISAHITDIMFPQNYALSLTDLVYIAGRCGLTQKPEAAPLLELLKLKETGELSWRVDYIYKYKGYVAFDTLRKPSAWVSALFPLWMRERPG